jgi:Prophage minor tail protein Z (GPZ)
MQLTIKTNFPQVKASLDRLHKGVADAALASAMNKVVDQARTKMIREITAEFNVKGAYVRDRLRVRRARAKGQFAIEAALLGGKGDGRRAANIIAFVESFTTLAEGKRRAKAGTQQQLFVKIKRLGPKKALKGTFIGNKGRTVFERVGKGRLPIKPVQVIDVPQMFNTKRINAQVVDLMRAKFPTIFAREARFYIDRFNRGGA